MECFLRQIPNVYRFKRNYLDENSKNIEILFLGSSHGFFDLNPMHTKLRSYNAGHVSQTIDFDLEILRKYKNSWNDLKFIVLPVSYFSLYDKLSVSKESWRLKDYTIYYRIKTSRYLPYNTEILSGQLSLKFKTLWSYYIQKVDHISCNDLGWGTSYKYKDPGTNLLESGKSAAIRHTIIDTKYFGEMCSTVDSIIVFAEKHNVSLLIVTPPAFESYRNNLSEEQLNNTIQAISHKVQKHSNCFYFNLLDNESFKESDFYDADHLNEEGARKLTLFIDSVINSKY